MAVARRAVLDPPGASLKAYAIDSAAESAERVRDCRATFADTQAVAIGPSRTCPENDHFPDSSRLAFRLLPESPQWVERRLLLPRHRSSHQRPGTILNLTWRVYSS
jgi:hypothetical protein